jgi:hypothetical protein
MNHPSRDHVSPKTHVPLKGLLWIGLWVTQYLDFGLQPLGYNLSHKGVICAMDAI